MPGGQFTNLKEQARSLGLETRWHQVAQAYADANQMFGDIVKVTPSSKVVGDMQDFLLRERQTVISERLKTHGRVLAAELALEFGVSEDTVRRDLREMAAAGLCERVYGGALPISPAHGSLTQRMRALWHGGMAAGNGFVDH